MKYLLLVLLLLSKFAFGQSTKDYVVVTFDQKYNYALKERHQYYWVVELESFNPDSLRLYPLFLRSETNWRIDSCCSGKSIDVTGILFGDSQELKTSYKDNFDNFLKLVEKEQRLVQTIEKYQEKGKKNIVKVYVAVVKGSICHCGYTRSDRMKKNYEGEIYLPNATFYASADFWSSRVGPRISKADFSFFRYNKFPDQ
jgi:hypothetical protein